MNAVVRMAETIKLNDGGEQTIFFPVWCCDTVSGFFEHTIRLHASRAQTIYEF